MAILPPDKADKFVPIDWNKQSVKISDLDSYSITNGLITANTVQYTMPGNLLDFSMEYEMDFVNASALPSDEMDNIFKKELASKLAEQMIRDGHIVFTKQQLHERHVLRVRAYTWVGNKSLIEQERKNKYR